MWPYRFGQQDNGFVWFVRFNTKLCQHNCPEIERKPLAHLWHHYCLHNWTCKIVSIPRRQAEIDLGLGEGWARRAEYRDTDNMASPDSGAIPHHCVRFMPAWVITFTAPIAGTSLQEPKMAHFNAKLAEELGLKPTPDIHQTLFGVLSGNRPWPGYFPRRC